jgi:hypothetical protein
MTTMTISFAHKTIARLCDLFIFFIFIIYVYYIPSRNRLIWITIILLLLLFSKPLYEYVVLFIIFFSFFL